MNAIGQHLAYLTLEGRSKRTIGDRAATLRRFNSWLGRDLLTATRPEIQEYLARPLAEESRRAYRSHLVSFYGWCVDEEILDTDPSARVPKVKVHRRLPRPISDDELGIALRSAPPRMRAWLLLMAYAGLRCMEVAALQPADLKPGPPVLLHLRVTKGGHEAVVPAHPLVVAALAPLPISQGRWWGGSPNYISTSVASYLRSVGVDATAHRLRHYAGTAWYEVSQYDLLATAQLLRHASVSSTQGYAKIRPARATEVALAMRHIA